MESLSTWREQLALSFGPPRQTLLGTVRDVDTESRTCTVEDDGALYYGVRLQCITGGTAGLLLVPANGASVLAVRVEKSEDWMVIGCDRLENVRIDVGGKSIGMTSGGIVLNGGELGLVKIDALVGWMAKVYADLNALATALNGVGLTFRPTTPLPARTDFEDTAVKH